MESNEERKLREEAEKQMNFRSEGYLARQIDRAYPPAKPEEYELPRDLSKELNPSAGSIAFDRRVRSWLHLGKFDKTTGSQLVFEIGMISEYYLKLTDAEKEAWAETQKNAVENCYKERTAFVVTLARQLVREINDQEPGLIETLEHTGAGDSALVISRFAEQAQRLYDRQSTVQ